MALRRSHPKSRKNRNDKNQKAVKLAKLGPVWYFSNSQAVSKTVSQKKKNVLCVGKKRSVCREEMYHRWNHDSSPPPLKTFPKLGKQGRKKKKEETHD